MKKDSIEIVFLLDRSGSMEGLEEDTIGGFNNLLNKQQKHEGEVILSTVLFDNHFEVLHNRLNIHKVKPLSREEYTVRGSTALLDAIGRSIVKIKSIYRTLEKSDIPERTMFVITTDGMENASQEFTKSEVKKMIQYQKERYDWEFLFLGANIDAVQTARSYGINQDRVANYHSDKEGTKLNYEILSDTISELRQTKTIQTNWKDRIDKDFNSRKK